MQRNSRPLFALEEINGAIDTLLRQRFQPLMSSNELPRFLDTLEATLLTLRFLYRDYLPVLRRRFSACFIVGSMSYGRFYSVRGRHAPKPSDLDLFIVASGSNFTISDFLIPGVVNDSFDNVRRLERYTEALSRGSTDLLNYKVVNHRDAIPISLTICSESGFENMLDLSDGEARQTCLRWTGSLSGGPNWRTDLAGRIYDAPYVETETDMENALVLPVLMHDIHNQHRLGRFNGYAGLLTPRFDEMFVTPQVADKVLQFLQQVGQMTRIYEEAGLSSHICDAHLCRDRFSPYFRLHMKWRFEQLLQQAGKAVLLN
jgi:hypothetical protein